MTLLTLILVAAILVGLSQLVTGLWRADPVQHHPSASTEQDVSRYAHVHDDEGQLARHSSRSLAQLFGRRLVAGWGGPMPYSNDAAVGEFVETKDGTGAFSLGKGGLKGTFQGAAANEDLVIVSRKQATLIQRTNPATGRAMLLMSWFAQVSEVTKVGWQAGFATGGGNELFTTAAADELIVEKALAANTFALKVNQNAAGVASFAVTLPTGVTSVAGVDNLFTLKAEVGTSAATTILELWVDGKPATIANLATAQAALYAMFTTTPPDLQAQFGGRVADAAARSFLVRSLLAEVD